MEPDGDLVMDLILFLWNKCKLAFQRAQVRHWHPAHYLGKMESQDKVGLLFEDGDPVTRHIVIVSYGAL